MSKIARLGGCLFVAGLLACGGAEPLPDEGAEQVASDELTPLHHNSPVYEEVDDLVSDTHDDAIDAMLDRMADVDQTVNQEGDTGDSTNMGDAEPDVTQTGDSPGYDGDDFMTQPNTNSEDSFDDVADMLAAEDPTETQNGTVDGSTTSTRTGEDEVAP